MSSSNDVLMEPRRMRLNSLDTWRGLVIFLMMLDHVRDFFNRGALTSTPTEAGHTTVLLYLTRWITHLCAPTFLFLAGVGIRLQYEKAGPSRGPDVSRLYSLLALLEHNRVMVDTSS